MPGWLHPGNKCPNGNPDSSGKAPSSPLKGGACDNAECDCAAFLYQSLAGVSGEEPYDKSENMPKNQ